MDLIRGKAAIVTGASSAIGACIAETFVAEPASVILAAAEVQAIAARLDHAASFICTDVANEADVKAMIGHALDRFGRLDCRVNNAGIPGVMVGIAETDAGHFDAVMAVHVRGAMLGIKHAAPAMLRQGGGRIVD